MRKKINKIAALFIVSIFALSGTGIAYAAWFDTITITGTVDAGVLQWEFANCEVNDDDAPENPGGDYPTDDPDDTCNPGFIFETGKGYYWPLDKNVGWGECNPVDTNGDNHFDQIQVTLHNVYPCYFNEVTFYTRNCGTIPLKFDHILINGVPFYSSQPYISLDLSGNGIDDFEIWWRDVYWGYQLEPEGAMPEISFWMHVLQDEGEGVQGESFTFTIEVVAIQWNEY